MIDFNDLLYSKISVRIIFVNVSRSCVGLDAEENAAEIKEMARGRWELAKNKQTDGARPQILVAVRGSIIIGIYRITGFHTGTDTCNFPVGMWPGKAENRRRRAELICLEKIRAGKEDTGFGNLYKKYYQNKGNIEELFDWWFHLYYFDCEPIETLPNDTVKRLLQICKGQQLLENGKPIRFSSVCYNY